MCTGPDAARCPAEPLAWELYQDHGYRPRALRPCLTGQHGQPPPDCGAARNRRRLRRLLRRG